MDATGKLLVFFAVWWAVWMLRGLYLIYRVWAHELRDDYIKKEYEEGL